MCRAYDSSTRRMELSQEQFVGYVERLNIKNMKKQELEILVKKDIRNY